MIAILHHCHFLKAGQVGRSIRGVVGHHNPPDWEQESQWPISISNIDFPTPPSCLSVSQEKGETVAELSRQQVSGRGAFHQFPSSPTPPHSVGGDRLLPILLPFTLQVESEHTHFCSLSKAADRGDGGQV